MNSASVPDLDQIIEDAFVEDFDVDREEVTDDALLMELCGDSLDLLDFMAGLSDRLEKILIIKKDFIKFGWAKTVGDLKKEIKRALASVVYYPTE